MRSYPVIISFEAEKNVKNNALRKNSEKLGIELMYLNTSKEKYGKIFLYCYGSKWHTSQQKYESSSKIQSETDMPVLSIFIQHGPGLSTTGRSNFFKP